MPWRPTRLPMNENDDVNDTRDTEKLPVALVVEPDEEEPVTVRYREG